MGTGHGHRLYFDSDSVLHRAPAHLKVLGMLVFVLVVVATPIQAWELFVGYVVILLAMIAASTVPFGFIAKRMFVEIPFVVFALVVPFVALGEQVSVAGLELSRPGLIASAALLTKGTIGVVASLTLAATTQATDLLTGLERLGFPRLLVQIMSFMIRYLDVVTDELRRMRIALTARGFVARDPRHWPVLARACGALFIRSYERGERVHLAMLSRGHTSGFSDRQPTR